MVYFRVSVIRWEDKFVLVCLLGGHNRISGQHSLIYFLRSDDHAVDLYLEDTLAHLLPLVTNYSERLRDFPHSLRANVATSPSNSLRQRFFPNLRLFIISKSLFISFCADLL